MEKKYERSSLQIHRGNLGRVRRLGMDESERVMRRGLPIHRIDPPAHPQDNADDPPEIPQDRLWYFGPEHWPMTWTAERALIHYGFTAPLDNASFEAFALFMFEGWGLDDSTVRHFKDETEAQNCYWDELADKRAPDWY